MRLQRRAPQPPSRLTVCLPLPLLQPFGPVLPIIRVKDVDQAVEHVNANRLALQVGGRPGRQAGIVGAACATKSCANR